ncbi:hypothetical protein F5882DRAFT_463990 [Hyaloscypha sp. PMI_1271]|nr:hypothetical protein F5882DRAFT_463990 [Hyaloscypha sp. PMI_1271]
MPKVGKSSKKWPNPEESTGELYKNVKLGRKECWEAVGDARQKFEEIASEIKAHLEKCSEPVANPVVWTIYMIGRNRQESAPTIMFCGRDKKALTEIKELIKNSGIMDRYPAFRMGSLTEEFRHFSRGKSRKRHKRRRRTVQPCSGPPEEGMRTIQQSLPETRIETQMLHNGEHITTFGHDKEFGNFIDGVEDRQQTHIGFPVGAGKAILYSPSDTGPGMKIFIRGFHGDSSLSRLATGGGFISHRGSTFLTTVAHAFCEDDVNALPTSPETCNIEFELDDESEEDDNMEYSSSYSCSVAPSESSDLTISGRIFSDTTSEASNLTILATTFSDTTLESEQSPTISSAADDMAITSGGNMFPELNSVASRLLVKSNDLLLPVGEHYILSTTDRRPGLDYCLIEIEANELLKSKQISLKLDQSLSPDLSGVVMRKPRDVDVVAAIGSGCLLKGRLSGTPSFLMLPGRNLVQEVWTVRYGTEVSNGDCGAWVVDASNGDLFGHIVGGSPGSGVFYIIPAYLIIDDLVDRFDGEWKPAGVVPEPVVPVSLPAPVHSSPASESVLPTRVLEPILPDPVPPPVVPDTVSVPGESKLRRSLYIK